VTRYVTIEPSDGPTTPVVVGCDDYRRANLVLTQEAFSDPGLTPLLEHVATANPLNTPITYRRTAGRGNRT
jgi:hypothetical protein